MPTKLQKYPPYNCWRGIKQRCYNTNISTYKYYGGRGIKVCDRWLESFANFIADMGSTWKEGLQLDRIDNNGNYEPSNCRWATVSQNQKNRQVKSSKQSNIDYVKYDTWQERWVVSKRFNTQEEAETACKRMLGEA